MFLPQPLKFGSLPYMLREYGEYLIRHDEFPTADPSLGGNPDGWCRVLLSKLVLLQRYHNWSEREAVRRARADMEVKACLGLGLEQPGPSQPTLSRHASLMQELGLEDVYLERLEGLLGLLGLVGKYEPVLVDTVPIRGAGQQLDSYNLLGGAIRGALRALAVAEGRPVDEIAAELGMGTYLARSIKGAFNVDWSDESARNQFLGWLVADARRVQRRIARVESEMIDRNDDDDDDDDSGGASPRNGLREAHGTIDSLIEHDVELDETGQVQGLQQNPGGGRRISLTDPDMRHGRKSASKLIAGFKAQLVTSLLYGFILLVKVIEANRHDGEALPALVEELHEHGHRPVWWGADHAYGTIANHHYFQDNQCGELVARMARPSNGRRFTKDQFGYDFATHRLTCPAGQIAPIPCWKTVRGKKGRLYKFDDEQCGGCPLRERCISPQAKVQRRSIFIVEEDEHLIRAHLKRRETRSFKARLKRRIAVEHTIASFAQSGGKQARRFGKDNVAFDAKLSALTCNLRRLGGLLRANPHLRASLQEAVQAVLCLLFGALGRLRALRRWLSAHVAALSAQT